MLSVLNLTTQSQIYISARNEQVIVIVITLKTIVALKPIFGKILLDKDWPFFCPHISTQQLLHWGFCLYFSDVRNYECPIEPRFKNISSSATKFSDFKHTVGKRYPQWSSEPYISRNFLIWTHFVIASWKKSDLRTHICSTDNARKLMPLKSLLL